MSKEFKKEDFWSCERCGIDTNSKGRMIPCPRGFCEAEVTGVINTITETIMFPKEKTKSFAEEWEEKYGGWRSVNQNDSEYILILALVKDLEPNSTSSSLHIHEEIYVVNANTYKLLYAIGDDTPMIEVKFDKNHNLRPICSCGLGEKVDGENYCSTCLKNNPLFIA
jgi:hypothetical protein